MSDTAPDMAAVARRIVSEIEAGYYRIKGDAPVSFGADDLEGLARAHLALLERVKVLEPIVAAARAVSERWEGNDVSPPYAVEIMDSMWQLAKALAPQPQPAPDAQPQGQDGR